jgi:hypothetical protein
MAGIIEKESQILTIEHPTDSSALMVFSGKCRTRFVVINQRSYPQSNKAACSTEWRLYIHFQEAGAARKTVLAD